MLIEWACLFGTYEYWLHSRLNLLCTHFCFFQRQWNHNPNFEIPTLLWRFYVSIGFICCHNSNRKWCFSIQDYRDHVQLCRFCHATSVLSKWWCQFQKQGSTTRLMESFGSRTFSEKYPNPTNYPMMQKNSIFFI